ncbi:hypothetical protein BDW22DRAFT_1304679, partial [Trametopsis cervina]
WPYEVVSSDVLNHRKSAFQAYATKFFLPADTLLKDGRAARKHEGLEELFTHIEGLSPRTKRATHRMWAYRCSDGPFSISSNEPSAYVMASYSDVEPASGSILERLLELNSCSNVAVVVYRWYGDVKIGGERWRLISNASSEALK